MNKKPKNLMELTKAEMARWLNSFDTVLVDCDGVLWLQDTLISQVLPGVPETIAFLKSLGKAVYFVTNNCIHSRRQMWEKTKTFGIDIEESHIIAPLQTMVEYLHSINFDKKAYIIGEEVIGNVLTEAGIKSFGVGHELIEGKITDYMTPQVIAQQQADDVGAVIVSFDTKFTFAKLLKAINYLSANADCLFISTNFDIVHRFPEYRIPGTGALLAAVEACVERKALQLGKPNPQICRQLIKSGKVVPARTLMIGDVCEIDILFGHRCGFQTLLVGTGPSRAYELSELQNPNVNPNYIPDYFVPALSDITKLV